MNSEAMSLSVIIPTLNRAADLSRTLPTLLTQTVVPDEVIIVDQTEDDSSKKVVDEFLAEAAAQCGDALRLIYVHHPGLLGVGVARNIAIEHATGGILVFLDDDVLLEPDFLAELLAVYQQDASVGGVSGVVTNYPLPSRRARLLYRLFWIGPFHDDRQPIYWNCEKLRHSGPFPTRKFGGGLMSLRREALDGERFDAKCKKTANEDVELSWRVSERWPLVITPRARLVHVRTDLGRPRDHWLTYAVKCDYCGYFRLWNRGIKNRLCFVWLNFGYMLLATASSAKRLSLGPWRAFIEGIRLGREQVKLSNEKP